MEKFFERVFIIIGYIIGFIICIPLNILFLGLVILTLPLIFLCLPFFGALVLMDYCMSELKENKNILDKKE
jgi:threonine/homoserine/homoserine lactone efflux protein